MLVVVAAAAGGTARHSAANACQWCPSSQAHKQGVRAGGPGRIRGQFFFLLSLQPKLDRGLLSGRLSLIMPSPFPVPCVRVQARWCSAATDAGAGQQHPAMAAPCHLRHGKGKRHDFRFASRPLGRPAGHASASRVLLADAVHYISLLELCRGAARESQEPCPCARRGQLRRRGFNSHPSVHP